ncbi:hypothetical protein Taro_001859 [Colocasia esculenta]|uniref:Uncharacterized protein n=1 Tax=Colocasia esculenta TaxID=4460 RepID=A0A843TH59_COLES|nr:hypothetical protein [Colocasia esculenta]
MHSGIENLSSVLGCLCVSVDRSTHIHLMSTQAEIRSTHVFFCVDTTSSQVDTHLACVDTTTPRRRFMFGAFMAPKQTPRRGAKARAAVKGVVIEEPPMQRRSKFRHDPSKRKSDSIHSGTPSK